MDIFLSPRRGESFPPKFHLILPKFYFSPTWGFSFLHVEIGRFPRGDQLLLSQKRIRASEILSVACGSLKMVDLFFAETDVG